VIEFRFADGVTFALTMRDAFVLLAKLQRDGWEIA
jgi:hypothetical protein